MNLTLQLVFLLAVTAALSAACAVLAAYVFASAISAGLDAPFAPTRKKYAAAIAEALAIRDGDVAFELGSGDGRITRALARAHPEARFVGIERNPLLVAYCRAAARLAGIENATFARSDIFVTDFSEASKAYAYLLPAAMGRLLPKLEREFAGTLVSRAFPITGKEPAAIVAIASEAILSHGQHLLYVYEFGARE